MVNQWRYIKNNPDYNCYDYFLKWTEEFPDYNLLSRFGLEVKHSEFVHQIDCLAAYFENELGLKRGDVYTILLPTCPQSFVAFYALNKIGVIISFVHPLSPPETLKELMVESGSKGIMLLNILAAKYVPVINELGVPAIICKNADYAAPVRKIGIKVFDAIAGRKANKIKKRDTYARAIKKYPPSKTQLNNGQDVAVYLNGGGTTGKSKTIKLTSFALNEIVDKVVKIDGGKYYIEDLGVESTIVVLPLFHAFGLAVAMHMPICQGGRMLTMMNFNAKRYNAMSRKNKIVFAVGIPVMFRKLMHEKNFDGEYLKHLRFLFCGGDDVNESFLDEFNSYLEKWGARAKLFRGYGLTEVASACSTNTFEHFRRNSIGKPLDGITMEIWDDEGNRVPNGTIGEIVITGTTVMEGYLDKDRTENLGVYIDENGTRWIRSGDLGYMDDDGFVFFSGRKKRIIIISGYNVYPNDVERKVEELPFIREVCAVQGFVDCKPIVRLYVSFIGSDYDVEDYKRQIMERCQQGLPAYSRPREIVVMKELPRTHMKKIDFVSLTETMPKAQ